MMRTPSMTSFMRLSERRKVLLPQPEGPISAVTRFSGRRTVIPSMAIVLP